jgi:hypothetical protein
MVPFAGLSTLHEGKVSDTHVCGIAIGGVEDSAQNKRHKGEEQEVDAVEVGFSLNEFLHCCVSEGHPGRALARWASAGCGLRWALGVRELSSASSSGCGSHVFRQLERTTLIGRVERR